MPVTLAMSANQLTITPGSGDTGVFVILATASDGTNRATEAFRATVS